MLRDVPDGAHCFVDANIFYYHLVDTMKKLGLAHLATNDHDFDQIAGITVWKPR